MRSRYHAFRGQAAVDLAISQELSLVFGARGRIKSAERAKPTLQESHGYNLTNLLSACSADTGHERKGDFHVKATPAESQSRTTQETSQVPVEASAGCGPRGFDSHSREPSWRNRSEGQFATSPFALSDAHLGPSAAGIEPGTSKDCCVEIPVR